MGREGEGESAGNRAALYLGREDSAMPSPRGERDATWSQPRGDACPAAADGWSRAGHHNGLEFRKRGRGRGAQVHEAAGADGPTDGTGHSPFRVSG
jgi:hypothetical protein